MPRSTRSSDGKRRASRAGGQVTCDGDHLALSPESRAALVDDLGADVAAILEGEVARALSGVRAAPLAEALKAERRALVAAKALVQALSYEAVSPVPRGTWSSLERLIDHLKGSSRDTRVRSARRAQALWERRTVEHAFLRVLRQQGLADNDAAAARCLAVVLRAAVDVEIDEFEPSNQQAALRRARNILRQVATRATEMRELLRATTRSQQ